MIAFARIPPAATCCFLIGAATCGPVAWCRADIVTLKHGMMIQGSPDTIASVKEDPLKAKGEVQLKQILIVDNQLTRTFVPTKQLTGEITKPAIVALEKIQLPGKKVAAAGHQIYSVGMPLRIDPF